MSYSEIHFVEQYEPDSQARVELANGRIVDVVNGRYYDAGTSIILQGSKIASVPGLAGEPRVPVDFTIDLKGKTVLPSLFNTHCHLLQFEPTFVPDLSDMRRIKRYEEQQRAKNMADCLAHGITHVRDAWHPDLGANRALNERISKGELPGPRILQAVAVGPTGSYMQEKLSLVMKVLGMPHVDDASKRDAGAVPFPIDATGKQVRDAVDRAIDERGAHVIKIGDEPYYFANFRLLYEHGVPMTTGNDNKPPCTPAMMDLELLMFDHVLKHNPEREPFSGAEAVKIATINSARSLGLDEAFGSIESGKTADLVILDGDPLEDFRVIGSRVAALFMDGKLVINNCGLEARSNGKAQGG